MVFGRGSWLSPCTINININDMKAKPIIIIRIPDTTDKVTKEDFGDMIKEYHIVTIREARINIEFEAFYEKDFNEVKYEELKQIIKDGLNDSK